MSTPRTSRSVSAASLPTLVRKDSPISFSPAELEAREAKTTAINAACVHHDLSALIHLATSTHGLLDDGLRRTVWPILLGCNGNELPTQTPWSHLPPHRDESQVALDVNRAFVYYPKYESDKQLDRRKEELSGVIVEVLRRHPLLCYFQGYHDIVQVFLLVLGAHNAPHVVARLSLLRIRDFMLPSLDPAISHLELLHPIIQRADPELYNHLPKMPPFFALAGTITMFAHLINEYADISRLFDFFLARDTAMPIYFFAAVVLSRREELLEIEQEDVDIFHAVLGKLPQPFHLEFHIARAAELHERLSPQLVRSWAWWNFSSSSVLKASRTPFDMSRLTLADGEALFAQQEIKMKRQQTLRKALKTAHRLKSQLWYYRRPGALGLAIAVGVYALWLGRNGGPGSRWPLSDFLGRFTGVFF
ncbi:hypothetical protein K504DRAFT_487718 [Pleomassaria siparia CBS 279.74]|uniref:Rab-GAP TBC domain-containing protein n=1 Tax=Pleomassaria siparia CBS 279.74 TaxID=1314801 RepID=A0A6G1KKA5_9PLEO|nr:hypothetical protein K504DRAFT_487718 [Pleomassaria siparia CBS 279.74]